MSHHHEILKAFRDRKSLTKLEALQLLRVMNFGARVMELREAGHRIETQMVKIPSGKRIARYHYIGGPEYQEEYNHEF